MYVLNYQGTKVIGATLTRNGVASTFSSKMPQWQEFLDWNAKQPVPLDLSDKEPEPLPVDREAEAIKVLLEKPDKDLVLGDLKGPLVRLLRERYGVSSKS